MARKGAMGKEPVLRGEARRAFKQEQMQNLPGPGGQRPAVSERRPRINPPVTAREPRETPMERLSPGVYRGSGGSLVGQGGQAIQRQPQTPMVQQNMQDVQQSATEQYNPELVQTTQLAQQLLQDGRFNMPQMPQPSANMGGQYRLSPGMYGSRDQAMQQYNQQMANMGVQNAPLQFAPNQMKPFNMSEMGPYGMPQLRRR